MIDRETAHAMLDRLLDAREEVEQGTTETDKELFADVVEPAVELFDYVAGDAIAVTLHHEGHATSAGGEALPKLEDFRKKNGKIPKDLTEEQLFNARALAHFVYLFRGPLEQARLAPLGLTWDLLGLAALPGRYPRYLPSPVRRQGRGSAQDADLAQPARLRVAGAVCFEAARCGQGEVETLFRLLGWCETQDSLRWESIDKHWRRIRIAVGKDRCEAIKASGVGSENPHEDSTRPVFEKLWYLAKGPG